MAISEFIVHIGQNYLTEAKTDFKDNELAKYIRHTPNTLMPHFLRRRYHIASSPGQGQWALVPWIGIFDKDISESALKGYYIVYLFTEDMKSVYLSLNQGWTFFQEAYSKPKEQIKKVSAYWKKELSTIPDDFSVGEMYLKSYQDKQTSDGRPSGYANGNICSKYYDIDSLPDDQILEKDLWKAILMLTELKSKLIGGSYAKTNDFILAQEAPVLTETSPPHTKNISPRRKQPISNIDYVSIQARNNRIGYLGELAVLESEREKLRSFSNASIRNLAKKIRHVSVEIGDGLGYDILSFDETGNEMYIEVKTTIQGIHTPFYLTANELASSIEHKTRYYLYRLYEFGQNHKYYVLNGALDDMLDLVSINYRALPKDV